jgi:hypothetical protein
MLKQGSMLRQMFSSLTDHGKHVGLLSEEMLRKESIRVYRRLFRQARALKSYDSICSSYVIWRTRTRFRTNQHETSPKRRKAELKAARKQLRLLGKANAGNLQALEKVIAYGYGTRGRMKHLLNYRINEIFATGKRNFSDNEKSKAVVKLEALPVEFAPLVCYCEDQAMQIVKGKERSNGKLNTQIDLFIFAEKHFESTRGSEMQRRRRRLYKRALQAPTRDTYSKSSDVATSIEETVDEYFSEYREPDDFLNSNSKVL